MNQDHDRLLLPLLYRRLIELARTLIHETPAHRDGYGAKMRLECHTVADIKAESHAGKEGLSGIIGGILFPSMTKSARIGSSRRALGHGQQQQGISLSSLIPFICMGWSIDNVLAILRRREEDKVMSDQRPIHHAQCL